MDEIHTSFVVTLVTAVCPWSLNETKPTIFPLAFHHLSLVELAAFVSVVWMCLSYASMGEKKSHNLLSHIHLKY